VRISKFEQPLGGGEGSVITYYFDCGARSVALATSRCILGKTTRQWVRELDFMDYFINFEDIKRVLNDCEDQRLTDYVAKELSRK